MDKQQRQKFSPEVRARAVRMVIEHRVDHASQWAAIVSIAAKIGCTAQTLHNWVAQAGGTRAVELAPRQRERERIKALERENRKPRQANECCARRRLILPRRSWTAGSGHDRLH